MHEKCIHQGYMPWTPAVLNILMLQPQAPTCPSASIDASNAAVSSGTVWVELRIAHTSRDSQKCKYA